MYIIYAYIPNFSILYITYQIYTYAYLYIECYHTLHNKMIYTNILDTYLFDNSISYTYIHHNYTLNTYIQSLYMQHIYIL